MVSLEAVHAIRGRAANEAFTLVDHLTGEAGQLVIADSKADGLTHAEGDLNGDGQADLAILIAGKHVDRNGYIL